MNDSNKIFLDGGFDPDWYVTKQHNGLMKLGLSKVCAHHKRVDLSYTKRAIWAEAMNRRGIEQTKCPVCKHWFFPEEIGIAP